MSTIILGIESSCDDTSAAVIKDGYLLSNVVASQAVHEAYGGVVPELASRAHQQNIVPVVHEALKRAGVTKEELSAVAFTRGPGLMGSLLVGVSFAKGFARSLGIPMVDVNHLTGHVLAHFIKAEGEDNVQPEFPFLCLLVSGGNSQIILVKAYNDMEILGQTIDDAAGEAFDKVARAVGLGYPGGPKIDKLAKEGNKDAIVFPRAKVDGAPYDFSFSGIKSAVLNYINHCEMKNEEINRADLVASFQNAVVEALVSRAVMAAKENGCKKLAVAGGVAANSALRAALEEECGKNNIKFYHPSPIFCTDNAAMIGSAGYYEYMAGVRAGWDLNAVPNLKLGEKSLRGRIDS